MRIALFSTVTTALLAAASVCAADTAPATLIWDGAHLAKLRASQPVKDPQYKEVLKRLRKNAEISLKRGPFSVMDKKEIAPSGDKHDYLSYARYWWPNPDTADGMPYIRRDGRTNEEILNLGDRQIIGMMYDDMETLALAGYLLNEKKYNDHAALLVRTWFLDPETRMNPHMKFGQAIPGRTDGRGAGIIDTRHLIRVLDAVRLLEASNSWTAHDTAELKGWMEQYLNWLRTNSAGHEERSGGNNHGTWYDAQTAALAMFVGDEGLAKQIVTEAKKGRIERCIAPDGRQAEELERSKSLHYCVFNLSAMSVLARIGESVDVDLWGYASPDGRSIRRGLDFVTPYLTGEQQWEHEQIDEMKVSPSDAGLFYMAASRYDEPKFIAALKEDDRRPAKFEYTRLLFPSE